METHRRLAQRRSPHGLDLAARDGSSAFEDLRGLLTERGIGRDDRRFRAIPHTLMFVQSEETIRRLFNSKHVAYGGQSFA